jgi:hypothetical protein
MAAVTERPYPVNWLVGCYTSTAKVPHPGPKRPRAAVRFTPIDD